MIATDVPNVLDVISKNLRYYQLKDSKINNYSYLSDDSYRRMSESKVLIIFAPNTVCDSKLMEENNRLSFLNNLTKVKRSKFRRFVGLRTSDAVEAKDEAYVIGDISNYEDCEKALVKSRKLLHVSVVIVDHCSLADLEPVDNFKELVDKFIDDVLEIIIRICIHAVGRTRFDVGTMFIIPNVTRSTRRDKFLAIKEWFIITEIEQSDNILCRHMIPSDDSDLSSTEMLHKIGASPTMPFLLLKRRLTDGDIQSAHERIPPSLSTKRASKQQTTTSAYCAKECDSASSSGDDVEETGSKYSDQTGGGDEEEDEDEFLEDDSAFYNEDAINEQNEVDLETSRFI